MRESFSVDLGLPTLLGFRGPDAVRYLNGQLTQDVKKVIGGDTALPSCVTDAKGKLQFRVYLTESADQTLWVSAPEGCKEALEARLTKYLIADEVEVDDLSGKYRLYHLVGAAISATGNQRAKRTSRFGVEGVDLWVPAEETIEFPYGLEPAGDDEVKAYRVAHGAPAWGREVMEGMLPPEADLDYSDISYQKGCYIGQEVISRIKTAGKVNQSLLMLRLAPDVAAEDGDPLFSNDSPAGVLTSVSPIVDHGFRDALGLVKRSADRGNLEVKIRDGSLHPVTMRS